MPAFYAHYRFGCDVLHVLPKEARALCEEHRDLFDIGLHGPDIFFFHKPLFPNPIPKYGRTLHGVSGRELLAQMKPVLKSCPDKNAALAYWYGFLCHMALDSSCHPGVYKAQKYTGAGHTAIETALDRMLLIKDGILPLQHDPCGHFRITAKGAETVSLFFPPVHARAVEKSLRSMRAYGHLLYIKSPVLRKTLDLVLHITGRHHESFAGLFMTPEEDVRCRESDAALFKLYKEAIPLAAELIEKSTIYIESEILPDPVFDRTFKGPL